MSRGISKSRYLFLRYRSRFFSFRVVFVFGMSGSAVRFGGRGFRFVRGFRFRFSIWIGVGILRRSRGCWVLGRVRVGFWGRDVGRVVGF